MPLHVLTKMSFPSVLSHFRRTTPPVTHMLRFFSESQDVINEVNRVMANPEDAQGNPVALDFSKGTKTKGYSKPYSNNYDKIFKKKNKDDTVSCE